MSDSTGLVPFDFSQLPSTQLGPDEVFNDLAKSGDFLGRMQLYTKGKAINRGLIPPGHYGVPESGEDITDLGDSVDILPLARRPKAMDLSDKEAIIVSYDVNSEEFQQIEAMANEKDSSCMYGPSFLVYERSTGRFFEFFCGSKSSRGESKKLFPFLPLTTKDIELRGLTDQEPHGPIPATLKVKLVEKGTFSWHAPAIVKCSTPFSNLPAMEVIVKEIEKFTSAKGSSVERVAEDTGKRRAR